MTTFLSQTIDAIKKLFRFLYLSFTSVNLYRDIHSKFTGYGVKFIFVLTYIGTVLAAVFVMIKIEPVKDYLENRVATNYFTSVLDQTLSNWESFQYDGTNISTSAEEPIMIKGPNQKVYVAIDAKDELTGNIKKNILFVFGKSKLFLNSSDANASVYQLPIDYKSIFGDQKKIIDADNIVSMLKDYINYFDRVYIYIAVPIMVVMNLLTLVLEKALMVMVVYIALKSFVNKSSNIKSSIRIVAFSCGLSALIMPFSLIIPRMADIANFAQLWCSCLVIYSILKKQF